MPSDASTLKPGGGGAVASSPPHYQLKSELARVCLPAANKDASRNVAWVNSICILFLLIGIFGSKPAVIKIKTPPPLEEVIPTIIEQPPPPPTRIEAQNEPPRNDSEKSAAPQAVVVTLDSPKINFSVPTLGNLLVPAQMAQAPPLTPPREFSPLRSRISDTGLGGDRPAPDEYPRMAKEMGQQGTVLLSMTVDENGGITSIEVRQSSGYPILDRSALEWVKRHWILPSGQAGRVYEAPIRYILAP